jgi:Cft2 family RNA processing exonuclease
MHGADTVGVYAPTRHHQESILYFALPPGLSSRYKHGLIYCTPCTAGLIQTLLDVPEGIIRMLEVDTEYFISGCTVTAMDANHSPGSCMFVIETAPTDEVGAWLPWTVKAF